MSQRLITYTFAGGGNEQALSALKGELLIGYGMPKEQTLNNCWWFCLIFASHRRIVFSSITSTTVDWQEIGSLSLDFEPVSALLDEVMFSNGLPVSRIVKLVYLDANVHCECGIEFELAGASALVVAASPSPGAVSIVLPESNEKLLSEFPIEAYVRLPLP